MKPFVMIAALLLFCGQAVAQPGTVTSPSNAALQTCLLGTLPDTWTTLKLTPDQLNRVQRVQEACKEECDAARARKEPESLSNADGSEILKEVKGILTAEQYRAWVVYCAGNAAVPPK